MKTVLIVDDETSFLLSLRDGLSLLQDRFAVVTAADGEAAVAVLQNQQIDLLVTDLRLPKMDGFELLAWVSRHQPQLPVIVMTAFSTPEIEARLAHLPTLQFMEKPLDLKTLQDGILRGLQSGPKSYIRGVSLATFLQLMRLEQKSCTLKISAAGQVGCLYIQQGELLDAVCGTLQGEAAALEIIGWDDAEIEMDGLCAPQEGAITQSLEQLLMEAFRLKDERVKLAGSETSPESSLNVHAGPSPPLTRSEGRREGAHAAPDDPATRLARFLARMPKVREFAIFDPAGVVQSKNTGDCDLAAKEPGMFAHLSSQLESELGFGALNCMVVNAANRKRYLLLCSENLRILALLRPGVQPLPVARELQRILRTNPSPKGERRQSSSFKGPQ